MTTGECSIKEGALAFLDEVQKRKANKAAKDDDDRENGHPKKDKTVRPKLSSNQIKLLIH